MSETSPAKPPPNSTAFPLVIPNLSCSPDINVSQIEINDVNPASTSDTKNNTPNNSLKAGNSLIIAGNTAKASPTPPATTSSIETPCCAAIKPSTDNTPIPANSSKAELLKPVIKALFVISDFLGK